MIGRENKRTNNRTVLPTLQNNGAAGFKGPVKMKLLNTLMAWSSNARQQFISVREGSCCCVILPDCTSPLGLSSPGGGGGGGGFLFVSIVSGYDANIIAIRLKTA